jgi:catechol 2,3-dioxygenase
MTPDLGFSHFGLFVPDANRAAGFYERVLGFVRTDEGKVGDRDIVFLSRDPREHHQIVFVSGRSESPTETVVNQISFRMPSLEALCAFGRDLEREGVGEVRPVDHGIAWALYFHDPDGHRIEVFADSPWYVEQPRREPFDIGRDPSLTRAATERWCREQPSFRAAEDFRRDVAARLAARSAR